MALGNRIREMRKMQRLSQEELAYRLGTNRVSLSQWENDKVTPDTDNLTKIAMALGTGVGYLLGETDNPVLDFRQCADAGTHPQPHPQQCRCAGRGHGGQFRHELPPPD